MNGPGYFLRGLQLLLEPKLRLFVIVPVLVNSTLFAALIVFAVTVLNQWVDTLIGDLPGWLSWLSFLEGILWAVVYTVLGFIVLYSFSTVANIIAAPFNALLAEKTEELLTGQAVDAKETFAGAIKDFPRAIAKELAKILYYINRALLVLIISFIFAPAGPILWFMLGAWMMALEYCDYPMDNHKHSLKDVKKRISRARGSSFTFGATIMGAHMVPVLNLVAMPAAVCGATVYWVEELKHNQ